MNSRERVVAAINHRPPDRVPVDIGASYATSFTVGAYAKVTAQLGLRPGTIRVIDPLQMLAETEQPVADALDTDVVGLYVGGGPLHGWQDWLMPDDMAVEMPADIELRQRPDGVWEQRRGGSTQAVMPPGGLYFDPVDYPKWPRVDPDALTDEVLRDLENRARRCRECTDRAVLLNTPYAISNSTSPDFLCALLLEKAEAHERLEAWADGLVRGVARLVDAVTGSVDIMAFSGDAGSQTASLFGPDLYRQMIVSHMRKVPEYLHTHSDIKFFLHSCGSVYELIDCFIDMGVDILNPLQLSAANMEPERLVSEFGGRIVFWGGGCDTQHVLPHGTADEVRANVARNMKHYATVLGFVFSQVHNIQPDVPVENILAMVEEVDRRKSRP